MPANTGAAVHAAFLDMIKQADPLLAGRLHEMGREKPFTVSPLQGPFAYQGRNTVIHAGDVCFIRLTSLDPTLSKLILTLRPENIGKLTLFNAEFRPVHLCSDPTEHPWGGQTSFDALSRKWLASKASPSNKLRLRFFTPTTFRSGKQNMLFPSPHFVFFSLAEKWRRHAPPSLSQEIPDLFKALERTSSPDPMVDTKAMTGTWSSLNEWVQISRYDLKTEILDFVKYQQIGFIGDAEFQIQGKTEARWVRLLHLLADFAFFAGVGYKTTMGMGQTHKI